LSVVDVSNLIAKGLGKTLEPQVVGKYREGDIRHCVADISKAKELLGYEPKVSLEGGMQELLAWVSEQQATDMVTQATSELSSRNLVR
jgi:dTDP-L-rhamnose 4-epimerase